MGINLLSANLHLFWGKCEVKTSLNSNCYQKITMNATIYIDFVFQACQIEPDIGEYGVCM